MRKVSIPSRESVQKDTGRVYFVAANRIQQLTTELYEDLFSEEGEAIISLEDVTISVLKYRKQVNVEVDLIKSACREAEEMQ
tara:strand:+ start:2552 stop:2797 length:246 start_codon:yes stop_codon:yes gene_type:complete